MNRPVTVREWQRITPRTAREIRTLMRIRTKAETAVDKLIALLDELADDPDLEEGEDHGEDAEGDGDADDEPSLGAPDQPNQSYAWGPGRGNGDDLEDDHDGLEPEEDFEPSLVGCNVTTGRVLFDDSASPIRGGRLGQRVEIDPGFDQSNIDYSDDDREEEHDGGEPEDEVSDQEAFSEGDGLEWGEEAVAPTAEYRERLRRRRRK